MLTGMLKNSANMLRVYKLYLNGEILMALIKLVAGIKQSVLKIANHRGIGASEHQS